MGEVVRKSKILIPKGIDFGKWAVIACDQFTSQKEYWEDLSEFVGKEPSALNVIFPEVYLNGDITERVEKINTVMQKYLDGGLFEEIEGFVFLERTVDGGSKRFGLVLSVDLESYDYRRVRAAIRATEDTITERLPVRMRIRENAPIELPHILLLIDDREKSIIEPIAVEKQKLRKLYDFELNMGGGHLAGYEVTDTDKIIEKFNGLLNIQEQTEKYGSDVGIMFAVGDGNHSMATAKEHWNKIKVGLSEEEREIHPARYALVEVMNIYDDALVFEPIHRVVTNCGEDFVKNLKSALHGEGKLRIITPHGDEIIDCPLKSSETICEIQKYIEKNMEKNGWEVDYIHGESHTREVTYQTGGIGLLMPEFSKDELFNYVVNEGNLPKKAFSIGSAENKKYYLEAKRIKL